MKKKLTMVSLTCRGKRIVRFVMAAWENGKARVDASIFESMALEAGCSRGGTYTFGN